MLKIYKFRPLGDEESFARASQILSTGNFWCSSLWDLNDPMEGVYTYVSSHENSPGFKELFSTKNSTRICSFSGIPALKNPTMWGYYGNGFRGIAIEVSVSKDQICKVTYQGEAAKWCPKGHARGTAIRHLLTTKLNQWRHECEYRYLTDQSPNFRKIGDITGVYFGDPYCGTENVSEVVANSEAQQAYLRYKTQLIEVAHQLGYRCCLAGLAETHGKWTVLFKELPDKSTTRCGNRKMLSL